MPNVAIQTEAWKALPKAQSLGHSNLITCLTGFLECPVVVGINLNSVYYSVLPHTTPDIHASRNSGFLEVSVANFPLRKW